MSETGDSEAGIVPVLAASAVTPSFNLIPVFSAEENVELPLLLLGERLGPAVVALRVE
jgi:predicted ABC-type transport system involved in lysophospholipase L1 biosynthesis ATPase subunit